MNIAIVNRDQLCGRFASNEGRQDEITKIDDECSAEKAAKSKANLSVKVGSEDLFDECQWA